MIIEDIVNELDKFITKYKGLKNDNQSLTQFKSDVKTALKNKGIINTNEDSEVVQSVTNYNPPSGSSNADYQELIRGIDRANVFKLSEGKLVPTGKIMPLIEDIKTNSVKIYSLQDITDVRLKSDTYKSRINYTITSESKNLTVGQTDYGSVTYNVLNVGIVPIEAEVTNNETTITYSCGGEDKTVTMPIQDIVMSNDDKSIFWTAHLLFNLYKDSNKDLRQLVSINESEEDSPIFLNGNITIKKFKTKPTIFSKLNSLNMGQSVNALLTFSDNGGNAEYIPVKLVNSKSTMPISINQGYNAGVIEIINNQLIFHCSDDGGRLYNQFLISTKGSTIITDTNIINKAKMLYQKQYGLVGIVMKADGSPITEEEAYEAGFNA